MKPITLVLVAVLLAALFALQEGVLEKSEVQRLERASQNLGELRTSALLPTYIGSLFLGSFRAVAIDILWIQMHRMGEEEHRYFERVEIMDLITKLQPRNPEAWAYQGWDAAYNIANQFRTGEDEELARQLKRKTDPASAARLAKLRETIKEKDAQFRTWVRLGLLKLAEGSRHLPDDAYLKYEIGKALWTKASWSSGIMEEQFLKAIEEDDELQRVLGEGLGPARRRTAFELAEHWFTKGQATLEMQIKEGRFRVFRTLAESMSRGPEEERRHQTTQMGLNIDLAAFTGFIYMVRYLNGIYKWNAARHAAEPATAHALLLEAGGNFSKASEQARLYRKLYSLYDPKDRDLHDTRVDLCKGLADLCADQANLPHPLLAADKAKLLARLEPIRWNPVDRNAPPEKRIAPVDDRYVLDYMGWLKRTIGGDAWEYNDDLHALHRGNLMMTGEQVDATIAPDLKDVDWFHYYAAPIVEKGHVHDESLPPGEPIKSAFQIRRVGELTLTVTVFALKKEMYATWTSFELNDTLIHEVSVVSDSEGPVRILVTAKSPSGDAASTSGYWIKSLGVRP
jgi:hypothetical protein